MTIELRKYNEVGELLIRIETTGSWGHVCYQDGVQRVSITTAADCMGRKLTGAQTWHRGAYSQMLGWESIEDTDPTAMEQLKKHQPVIWKHGTPQVPDLLKRWSGGHRLWDPHVMAM